MLNNFFLLLKLIRIGSPTGYLLCFFPACYGLLLASPDLLWVKFLPLFFIGSVVARSIGCIINDIFDRDYDSFVDRTKERPLASRQISIKLAIVGLVVVSVIGIGIILCLSKLAIYLCMTAACMIILYPLMKRITYFPQVFLGFTFNMGVLIAYANIKNFISIEAIIMYIGCCFWTIGFDTIYGFADTKDDENVGIKSLSILLKYKKYKYYLFFFYISFISLFYLATYWANHNIIRSIYSNLCIIISIMLLLYQIMTLDITNSNNCITVFKTNNYVGALLFAAIVIAKYQFILLI